MKIWLNLSFAVKHWLAMPGRTLHGCKRSLAGDDVTLEGDIRPGEPLLQPVMQNGPRLGGSSALSEIRTRVASQLAQLPETLLSLKSSEHPTVC
jgi:nicotinate phosphoribosyltransferase